MPRGHVQAGLFAGWARFDPDAGDPDNVPLWGMNLSTKIQTVDKDNAIVQITFGDGVGRYRGGVTAAPDASGNLEAIGVFAILGSYQHHWTDEHRSTIGYSWAGADLPSGAGATAGERVEYFFANVIWQFADRAWTGFEYLYGSFDTNDHAHGGAHRIQAAIRFDL